jgi:DNA repair ATPase RecN
MKAKKKRLSTVQKLRADMLELEEHLNKLSNRNGFLEQAHRILAQRLGTVETERNQLRLLARQNHISMADVSNYDGRLQTVERLLTECATMLKAIRPPEPRPIPEHPL